MIESNPLKSKLLIGGLGVGNMNPRYDLSPSSHAVHSHRGEHVRSRSLHVVMRVHVAVRFHVWMFGMFGFERLE